MSASEERVLAAGDTTIPGPRPSGAGAEAALAELSALDDLPVDRHIDVYERAHRRLQDAMADSDDA